MAAPTEDHFPQTIIVDLEEAAMGWVLRLHGMRITVSMFIMMQYKIYSVDLLWNVYRYY